MRQFERGFTLIEVLVALVILATVLGIAFTVFSDNLQLTQTNERKRVAAMYAQSKLAVLGKETPLEHEPQTGAFDDEYDWTVSINDYGDDADRESWPLAAKMVTLTVSWMDGPFDRSFTLSTLRLVAKE